MTLSNKASYIPLRQKVSEFKGGSLLIGSWNIVILDNSYECVLQHLHDSVSERRSAYNNSADVRSVLKAELMALKTFF
jgi:hypothetical protein